VCVLCIPTHTHTHKTHTYVHTHIHTHVHTYIHTYIHTHIPLLTALVRAHESKAVELSQPPLYLVYTEHRKTTAVVLVYMSYACTCECVSYVGPCTCKTTAAISHRKTTAVVLYIQVQRWLHVHARQLLLYLIVRQPPVYCIYRYNGGCMYMQDNCCYICTQAIHTQKCMCIICGVKSVDEEFLQPPLYLYILQPPLYLYMRHTWRHEQHFAHASHASPLCTHKARIKAVDI
jgi:hypothetical protein